MSRQAYPGDSSGGAPRPIDVMVAGGGSAPAALPTPSRARTPLQPHPYASTTVFAEPLPETGWGPPGPAPPLAPGLAQRDPIPAPYQSAAMPAPYPHAPMPAPYSLAAMSAPVPLHSVPLAVPPIIPMHAAGASVVPPSPDLPGDGTYDVILEAVATVTEQPPGVNHETGHLQVIQGQIGPNPADGFYAFLSIGALNVPLVSSSPTRRLGPSTYLIFIRDSSFVIEFDPRTEPQLVGGFESVLGWFTTWEGSAGPSGAVGGASSYQDNYAGNSMDAELAAAVQSPIPVSADASSSSKLDRAMSAIEKGGSKGVDIVTKVGSRVNVQVSNYADKTLAKQGATPPKQVKLGGAPTAAALNAVKTVVGIGASLAAKMVDNVANNVSSKVAASKTVHDMRTAPVGSSKRTVHDLLVSGSVAIARVYLAADHQGRLICEATGITASRVVGARYGTEAENATREGARIALDTYKIIRFPTRLGATTMLKGALKGATGVDVINKRMN
jgi:hypothetical protein